GASGPVIHRLDPAAAAILPSREAAYFQVTNGRPRRWPVSHASLPSAASASSTPPVTATPAARSTSAPPAAAGLGSATAKTTLATPASTRASTQGGVRP